MSLLWGPSKEAIQELSIQGGHSSGSIQGDIGGPKHGYLGCRRHHYTNLSLQTFCLQAGGRSRCRTCWPCGCSWIMAPRCPPPLPPGSAGGYVYCQDTQRDRAGRGPSSHVLAVSLQPFSSPPDGDARASARGLRGAVPLPAPCRHRLVPAGCGQGAQHCHPCAPTGLPV